MTTARQYVNIIRDRQDQISVRLGADIRQTNKEIRVMNTSAMAMLAVLVKTVVDKGLITDADLNATFNTAMAEIWPELPNQTPVDP